MRLTLRWVNRDQWNASMRNLRGEAALSKLEEGVGRGAIRVQQAMRQRQEAMIYSQPPAASGYVRTRTLMRSTHAAAPGTDHGGDESRASGGGDLVATDPTNITERRGNQIASEIGSWIPYAEYVHEGVRQPSPRPFVTATVLDAERALQEEVERAVQAMAAVR